MTLTHYAATPFIFDPTYAYVQQSDWKPRGLWLSVDDGDDGWADWCRGNEFNIDGLKHQTRFALATDASILHLTTELDIVTFENQYQGQNQNALLGDYRGLGVGRSIG